MTFITNLGANLPKLPEILANPAKPSAAGPAFPVVWWRRRLPKTSTLKTATKFAEYLSRLIAGYPVNGGPRCYCPGCVSGNNKDLKGINLEGSGK